MLVSALIALIVPSAIAAAITALGGRRWWGASAIGLAYLAGHVALARPAVPPGDVTDRIPWLALAALLLALFEAARSPRNPVRRTGRGVLAALTLALILGPVVVAGSLPKETVVWLLTSTAVVVAAWVNLEALDDATPKWAEFLLALTITGFGAGVVLLSSGSAILGFLGLALAAALAGSGLVGWGRAPVSVFPVAASVMTALVLEGYVYASEPAACAVLLAVAPAGAWVTRIGPAQRLGPWGSAALGAAAVLVPVGIAVAVAVAMSPTSEY